MVLLVIIHLFGSDVYRSHIFTASGEFSVSAIGDFPAVVDLLVVGGGGGGGGDNSGAGGGGGVLLKSIQILKLPLEHKSITILVVVDKVVVWIHDGRNGNPGGVGGGTGTGTTFVDPSTSFIHCWWRWSWGWIIMPQCW